MENVNATSRGQRLRPGLIQDDLPVGAPGRSPLGQRLNESGPLDEAGFVGSGPRRAGDRQILLVRQPANSDLGGHGARLCGRCPLS